jgi:hypothetical protein
MEVSGQLNAPARKKSPVPIEQEAEWAPEPVWTFWRIENFAPTGIRPADRLARSLIRCTTDNIAAADVTCASVGCNKVAGARFHPMGTERGTNQFLLY